MWTKEASKNGAKASAERSRQKALDGYYASPNLCKNCELPILVNDNEQVAQVKLKKFCTRSCSALHSNRNKPKNATTASPTKACDACGSLIRLRAHKGGYRVRKHCDLCKIQVREERSPILNLTKKELRKRYSGTTNYHSVLRAHSRKTYANSKKPRTCAKCGYSTFVQVCHLRDVSDFPDTAFVKEINHIDNLVALCPTHHWELDHCFLDLK